MLAKTMIEEKNEMLDQKDDAIRTLSSQLQALRKESEELRQALQRSSRRETIARTEERSNAVTTLVTEVVRIAAGYEDVHGSSSTGLASKIYTLLEERYDLRVIADTPRLVDPTLHHVVEVDRSRGTEGSIEILSNGYRLGETVIRPALVKVVLGVSSGLGHPSDRGWAETIGGNNNE